MLVISIFFSIIFFFNLPMNKSQLFTKQSRLLKTQGKKPCENIVGKGAFSSFPTMFSTLSKTKINILVTFILSSANAFNLDWSTFCGLVKSKVT